jgi:hypothetical protein
MLLFILAHPLPSREGSFHFMSSPLLRKGKSEGAKNNLSAQPESVKHRNNVNNKLNLLKT